MSYHKRLRVKIGVSPQERVDSNLIREKLKDVYKEALRESKKTGQSISSITYEILDSLEESYKRYSLDVEKNLIDSSYMILTLIHENSRVQIDTKEERFHLIKYDLIDAIEREIHILDEFLETVEEFANDSSYEIFKKSLSNLKDDTMKKIKYLKIKLQTYK